MPIFSNRSIARLLHGIEPMIGPRRAHDLRQRLGRSDQSSIAAEWEIAAIHSLARQGKVRATDPVHGTSDLDVVYSSHSVPGEVAVEITAISDESLHERNPVDDFNREVGRLGRKYGLHRLGGIYTHIGNVQDSRGPVLGIPLKKDFDAFFREPAIRAFFERIRTEPAGRHEYRFTARGAESVLVYEPGRANGGSGYASPTVLVDATRNPIERRLKDKDQQIRESGLALPAVVLLCDAGCHALGTQMRGPGTYTASDVIERFLQGREHIEMGPWKVQQGERPRSRRINAVITWSLRERWNTYERGLDAREVRAHVVPNRGTTHHEVRAELVIEVAEALKHLPPIVNMPINALRKSRFPVFYGGVSTGHWGPDTMSIKLSLLTLQHVITGQIEYGRFAEDHADAIRMMKGAENRGLMLSDVRIEHVPDRDDDWVELVFARAAPQHLFEPDNESKP